MDTWQLVMLELDFALGLEKCILKSGTGWNEKRGLHSDQVQPSGQALEESLAGEVNSSH